MIFWCSQVTNLRARGVQFLDVPDKYYTNLKERLKKSPVIVKEDIDTVRNPTCNSSVPYLHLLVLLNSYVYARVHYQHSIK